MKKFSIIISQGGNASHKEECNNITKIHGQRGMQKIIDKEECKNSWIRRNAKIF
jgi:hexokinase